MSKPYSTNLAVWGGTAVLTLCHCRRTWAPDHSELALRYVLASLPGHAEAIVLDLDHGPRKVHDRDRVLRVVHRYAVEHSLYLVSVGTPRMTDLSLTHHTPGTTDCAPDERAGLSLSRALVSAALTQRAAGIHNARERAHPCRH